MQTEAHQVQRGLLNYKIWLYTVLFLTVLHALLLYNVYSIVNATAVVGNGFIFVVAFSARIVLARAVPV